MTVGLSFSLPKGLIEKYADERVPWGFPIGAGDTLGELTFLTRYSHRDPETGMKERWHQTCQRVIEGMYSILLDHCRRHRTPWDEGKALRSASEAYIRMFQFKWLPPGRGLWKMGSPFVHDRHNSAALQNCAFISTAGVKDATPFTRLMEMSMLGVGVGFDCEGAGQLILKGAQKGARFPWVVADSREGWCASVGALLSAHFFGGVLPEWDYSQIRPKGTPIKGFGGVAQGADALIDLHVKLDEILARAAGQKLDSRLICDIMNLEGRCIVAGDVRRSSEIALGRAHDKDFLGLKDWEANPERMGPGGWGNMSNNSIIAHTGQDLDHVVDQMLVNGEPGLFYLDLAQRYGRLGDPPNNRDHRATGTNPCGEQTLESFECCTLVETFPIHHTSIEDYRRTLKYAYLYGKAVTLLPTHWPETNEVMRRNRRIGCSVSGQAQFVEKWGWPRLIQWLRFGYEEIQARDQQYSEWLGERPSIKTTSVKPSGTVSLLAGVTPGVHWPVAATYIRRMRLSENDPLVEALAEAGYHIEPDQMVPRNVVIELPTKGPQVRTQRDVSVWEQAEIAAAHQRHWADNQVSVTLTFGKHEKDQIAPLIRSKDGSLKAYSLLPLKDEGDSGGYAQMPYEEINNLQWKQKTRNVRPLNWGKLYGEGQDAQGELYCDTDKCEIGDLE